MQIEKIGTGMRLWDSHSGDHCRVLKINVKTVRVKFEAGGVEANLPPARLETMLFPAQECIKAGDKVRLTVRLGSRNQGLVGTVEVDQGAKLRVLFDGDKYSVTIRRKELLPAEKPE